MKILKIGRHRIQISIKIKHWKLPNFKGIWDGKELISKKEWDKKKRKQYE